MTSSKAPCNGHPKRVSGVNSMGQTRLDRRRLLAQLAAAGIAAPVALRSMPLVAAAQEVDVEPPVAEPRPETFVFGDVEITDPYAWLEDPEDPEVIAYLEAENAYREAVMAPLADFQDALYQELLGRIQETDVSVPIPLDGWFYYSRTEEGLQYPIFARKKDSLDGPEELLFDLNQMLRTDYIALLGAYPSPDHRYIAYVVNETGGDDGLLRVLDTTTSADLPDEIYPVAAFTWANDNQTLFYIGQEEDTLRAATLHRHSLGDDPASDALLYTEEDQEFSLFLSTAKDRSYIFLNSATLETGESRFLPADDPSGDFVLCAPRRDGILYALEHHGDDFLILTNEDAQNFKVMAAPVADFSPASWRELVPHRPDALIESITLLADYLVLFGRQDALAQVWARGLGADTGVDSNELTRLTFDEAVYDVWPGTNWEFDTSTLRIEYTSYVTPISVYDVDLRTGERTLLKQEPVRGGHDPAAYVSEMLWAVAPDGVEVPISLVRRRDMGDGPHPAILYGYGAYGYPAYIYFDPNMLSFIDRGVTYAQAHVRGGADLGREWYEEGKLLNKKNTFTDFIACAEHLIEFGETKPDRLVGWGGSAGGLMIANVVNQRPDLFAGIQADVPWTDVVRTMLDPTIPLVTVEYTEWGDPSDPEYREYMLSYSPYDNIAAQDYPPMLVTAGLEDDRVMYWDPAKWTAKLRAAKTDDNLLLLRMNMGAGHSGDSGRYDYLREIAHDTAFVLMTLGLVDAQVSASRRPPPPMAKASPAKPASVAVRQESLVAAAHGACRPGTSVRGYGSTRRTFGIRSKSLS